MLPTKHRLKSQADILAVLRSGRQYRAKAVKVSIKPASDQAVSRVACVVGKTVSPLATIRHHYQRWLRVIAAEVIKSRPDVVDIVFVAQKAITEYKDLESLRQDIKQAVASK